MEYKTLYDTGDKVWLMHANKAIEATIESVKVVNFISPVDVKEVLKESYYVRFDETHCDWINDDRINKLFKTKQDLINSL